MFEHLRRLLKNRGQTGISPDGNRSLTPMAGDERRLAAAVLLLEVARADYEHQVVERDTLRAGLAREFGVPQEALDELLAQAELRAKESVSLFDYVQTLNRALSVDDKRGLLTLLWQVAQSDGRVDPQEEHLVRRLAALLHLSHEDFIRGKLTASGDGR